MPLLPGKSKLRNTPRTFKLRSRLYQLVARDVCYIYLSYIYLVHVYSLSALLNSGLYTSELSQSQPKEFVQVRRRSSTLYLHPTIMNLLSPHARDLLPPKIPHPYHNDTKHFSFLPLIAEYNLPPSHLHLEKRTHHRFGRYPYPCSFIDTSGDKQSAVQKSLPEVVVMAGVERRDLVDELHT